MLHEVTASDLDITHIVSPVRKLLKNVKIFNGDVDRIDLETKTVHVSHGKEHHHHELNYDHLVLGLGSVTNFYGNRGLEKNALTMKSLGDDIVCPQSHDLEPRRSRFRMLPEGPRALIKFRRCRWRLRRRRNDRRDK